MKKLLTLIAILSLFTPTAYAGVLSQQMGIQPPYAVFGSSSSVSATTFAVDAAYGYGSATGEAAVYRLNTPVFQNNGTLDCYVYATAKTGSPTGQEMILYTGAVGATDDDRPEPVAVATSTNLDVSALTLPAWIQFSFPSVTLATSTYFLAITNTTATPASNFVTYLLRPQNFLTAVRITGLSTSDGFGTDPVLQSSGTEPAIVCKFADGTLIGNPYITSTAHPSNTNWRGMRFQYDTDIEVAGFLHGMGTTVSGEWRLYQGSTLIESFFPDRFQNNNSAVIYFATPRTFTGGLPYDIIFKPVTNATAGARSAPGASPPTDVANAMFSQMGHLTGATPGSLSYTAGEFASITLLPNAIPAASGGGGGSVQVPAIWGF